MEGYSNIYLNPEEMLIKIEALKEEKNKMENVFQNIKNDNLGMLNYWSGTKGEESYESLKGYTGKFPSIINEIDSYIKFLENVVTAYKDMDRTITNRIDDNANTNVY